MKDFIANNVAQHVARLSMENEKLRAENEMLRTKRCRRDGQEAESARTSRTPLGTHTKHPVQAGRKQLAFPTESVLSDSDSSANLISDTVSPSQYVMAGGISSARQAPQPTQGDPKDTIVASAKQQKTPGASRLMLTIKGGDRLKAHLRDLDAQDDGSDITIVQRAPKTVKLKRGLPDQTSDIIFDLTSSPPLRRRAPVAVMLSPPRPMSKIALENVIILSSDDKENEAPIPANSFGTDGRGKRPRLSLCEQTGPTMDGVSKPSRTPLQPKDNDTIDVIKRSRRVRKAVHRPDFINVTRAIRMMERNGY